MKSILIDALCDAAPVVVFSLILALFGWACHVEIGEMNLLTAVMYVGSAILAGCSIVFVMIGVWYYSSEASR